MTGTNTILEFRGIAKSYGATPVLQDVNLTVESGDFLVVYGPPAAGKTVLMRILMGLETPDAGTIHLRGQDATRVPAAQRNIGYVPQSFALYPHISVHDNIAYPLRLAGVSERDAEPIVQHAAEMLKISDLLKKRPDQLSGGQKQRVAIARGIAKQTDIYVLDDPLAGLDFKLREQLVDDLRGLQQSWNATFLYTTSDAIEALTLADRVAVLAERTIVEAGTPEQLYDAPERIETMRLLGFPQANFLPGEIAERNGSLVCRTPLFEFAVRPDNGAVSASHRSVTVGLRPESIAIASSGSANGAIQAPARVLLQEDLGGEEIVYLDANGVSLMTVVRHDTFEGTIPDRITIALDPTALIVFAPDGKRVGQGVPVGHV
ncbi:MAG TPA: ABC transporter ATP-binding protein [Thermomicrobiales bacterium]